MQCTALSRPLYFFLKSNARKKIGIDPPLNFHTVLFSKIHNNISEWATGAGSFVVVSLLETAGFKEVEQLKTQLKKHTKAIAAAAAAGNKGSNVIIGKL